MRPIARMKDLLTEQPRGPVDTFSRGILDGAAYARPEFAGPVRSTASMLDRDMCIRPEAPPQKPVLRYTRMNTVISYESPSDDYIPPELRKSDRDRTNRRATVKRPPARAGERWIASHDGSHPLSKDFQPGAHIQGLLSQFLLSEDSLGYREATTLGQYLGLIHGAKLLLGHRAFAIKRRAGSNFNKYHLTTITDDSDWPGVTTSVFDGKPYRGPVINLYASVPDDNGESTDTPARTRSSIAGNKRGTLGGLLFGALEAAKMNRWPRDPDPQNVIFTTGVRQYFSALQIVPGVSAVDFLYFAPLSYDAEQFALTKQLRAASSKVSQAAALFLLEIRAVTVRGLLLPHGETLKLSGEIKFCGLGTKFRRAFALVSFAQSATNSGYGYRDAFVIPVCNSDARIPVESSNEDQVFLALTKFVSDANQRGIAASLEKPLFCYVVEDKLVRPDATLSVAGTNRRCHIEVLGFDSAEYLSTKANSESILVRQGHVVIPVPAYAYKTATKWTVGLLDLASRLRREVNTSTAMATQARR